MGFQHGKAIFGGRELSADELRELPRAQFEAIRDSLYKKAEIEKSDDLIDQRIAEELRSAKRLVESVQEELNQQSAQAKRLDAAEDLIEEIADIVEAQDDCEAISQSDDDLKRRLLRRSIDGVGTRCDNQSDSRERGSRIRRQID